MTPPRLAEWLLTRAIGDPEATESVLGDLYHDYRARPPVLRDLSYLWEAARIAVGYAAERVRNRSTRQNLIAAVSAILTGWNVRQAVRLWRRRPGFTGLTVLTLGLGIGATTAIVSVVDRVMLQALPYPDPQELVSVWNTYPGWRDHEVLGEQWDRIPLSYPEYSDWRDGQTAFKSVAIYSTGEATMSGLGDPALIGFGAASPSLFPLLGVEAQRGRTFAPGEDGAAGVRVAVVSHGFWRGRMGGVPDPIDRNLTLDGERYTVIGVLPEGFRIRAASTPDVWVPAGLFGDANERGWHLYQGVGRLRSGVTLERAATDAGPLLSGHSDTLRRYVRIVPRQAEESAAARGPLLLLLLAALVLMSIAGVNVATLFTAEAARRRHEYAVRRALGASRWQLARQFAVESGAIGILGAALGTGIAFLGVPALLALAPPALGLPARIPLDLRILAAAGMFGALAGVICGVGPSLLVGRAASGVVLTLRALGNERVSVRIQRGLIAVQAALAVVLLVGAGLLGRTIRNLQSVDPGFLRQNLVAVNLPLSGPRTQPHLIRHLAADLMERLGALPGIEAVSLASSVPFGPEGGSSSFDIAGKEVGPQEKKPEANRLTVTPGFHAMLGIPVLAGRAFTSEDRENGRAVVLVSQSLAKRYWPGTSPVGSYIIRDDRRWEVVGVVGDVLLSDLGSEPRSTFYFPFGQQPPNRFWVVLRSRLPIGTLIPMVRGGITAAAPDVALGRIAELGALVRESAGSARYRAVLVAAFGGCALLLAAVGILGLTARMVTARRRELGIRVALGAQQYQIIRTVMTAEARALGVGIVVGLGLSALVVRGLEGVLFGVSPWHHATFVQAAVLLAGVGLLASWVPARGAAGANPMEVLRME